MSESDFIYSLSVEQRQTYYKLQNQKQVRLLKLSNLIWETRWVSEEEDYQKIVGIAAEIRSGNFKGIDEIS